MTDYSAISDAEVAPGQPAFSSVMRRQRDNLKALAEGSATVPVNERLTAGSFKPPTSASQTQVLGAQGLEVTSPSGTTGYVAFQGVVVVPGVYTFAGTRSSTGGNTVTIIVNGVTVNEPSTASFTYQMTLNSGDTILVGITAITSVTFSDFRLLSEFVVPMAQCQFFGI